IGGTVQFSAATYTVLESAGNAVITVTRTGGTAGGATVDFATSNGTATAGADYTTTTSTLTFGIGQTTQTVLVPIADDPTFDGVETVNLTLSNPGPNATTKLGTRTTAVLRLLDNELALGFSAPTYSVRESAGVATITVELTGVNVTPVTVNWATSNGSATAGSDYGVRGAGTPPGPTPPPSGTLTFAPGGSPTTVRTRTFTVPILQDAVLEGTETVNLTLSGPVGATVIAGRGTAVLSIQDDDIGGTIQFSAATYSVLESAGNAVITVTRTGGTAGGATVDFATSNGTATAGADYTTTTSTLTFGIGQT